MYNYIISVFQLLQRNAWKTYLYTWQNLHSFFFKQSIHLYFCDNFLYAKTAFIYFSLIFCLFFINWLCSHENVRMTVMQ